MFPRSPNRNPEDVADPAEGPEADPGAFGLGFVLSARIVRSGNMSSPSPSPFRVELADTERDPAWDEWVACHPQPHPEQTSGWGAAQRCRGWVASRLVVRREDRTVGGVQVLTKRLRRFLRVAYVQRGPLLAEDTPEVGPFLLRAILDTGRLRGWTYLSMILPYEGGPTEAELGHAGFVPQPKALPPQSSEGATIVVDLTPPEDEILGRMRRTTRRYIRQGEERGLTVREGSASDLDRFGELMLALCARRKVRANVPTGAFLHGVWQAFHPTDRARLFLADRQGQTIAGLIVLALGDWARAWRIGWSGESPELRPNESLYWEAMRWAKRAGHRYFDFMGFDTETALALREGRECPTGSVSNLAQFKLGLGGTPKVLRPFRCRFFHPALHGLVRAGGLRILEWNGVRRFLGRRLARMDGA